MTDDAPRPRAIIFDLDEAIVDARPAWIYAIEETLMSVTASRQNVRDLVPEYRRRPLWDVLSIFLAERNERLRAERMARTMLERSALKKLLVHEGVGMALDELRVRRIEMGAISRYHHSLAIKHLQSTGLDRFFAVLSPTPPGESWTPQARIAECLSYLDYPAGRCAFVSGEKPDLVAAQSTGIACFAAAWVAPETPTGPSVARASDLSSAMLAAWATRSYA